MPRASHERDDGLAVDDGTRGIAEIHEVAPELVPQVVRPQHASVVRVEAMQNTGHADRVQPVSVQDGRRIRPVTLVAVVPVSR